MSSGQRSRTSPLDSLISLTLLYLRSGHLGHLRIKLLCSYCQLRFQRVDFVAPFLALLADRLVLLGAHNAVSVFQRLIVGIGQQAFKGGDFGIDGVDAFKRFFH